MNLPPLRPLEAIPVQTEQGVQILLRDPAGYAPDEVLLSEAAFFLVSLLDGRREKVDIQEIYMRRYGEILLSERLEEMVGMLDEALLLDSPRFHETRERIEREFRESPRRPAVHAGVSYPPDPAELEEAMRGWREDAEGLLEPGEDPPGRLRALIAPHLDLRFAGGATALAYRRLESKDSADIDTILVLGTSHAAADPCLALTRKAYETPLGTVPTDTELVEEIAAALPYDALAEEQLHRREHSIEFQALFLADLARRGREVRMAPVLVGSLAEAVVEGRPPGELEGVEESVAALREAIGRRGERVAVVAAVDLAHLGPRFGDPAPPAAGPLEAEDRETLRLVARGDAEAFFRDVARGGDPRHICGLSAIYFTLRSLDGTAGRVLAYGQAADPTGTVSYASVALFG